jgi:hypothetical protein
MFALMLAATLSFSEVAPPSQFQGNNGANIQFVSDYELLKACGIGAVACVKTIGNNLAIIIVLNPCKTLKKEDYSTVLCHELGHVNGWEHK